MLHSRDSAIKTFETALDLLDAKPREVGAWQERCLLEALVAITSGDHDGAVAYVSAAQRPPTAAEVSALQHRILLTRAEIRDQFDDLVGERPAQWRGPTPRPHADSPGKSG